MIAVSLFPGFGRCFTYNLFLPTRLFCVTGHRFTWVFATLCTTILLLCPQARSQTSPAASDSSQQQSSQQGSSQQGSQKKKSGQIEVETPGGKVPVPANASEKRRFSFVFAPIPISSPALGTGAVPVAAVIFPLRKSDTESQPSAAGAAGLLTNNGTRAYAVAAQLYFKQDTYRATAAYFQGNLNYDLYGIGAIAGRAGLKLPLTQQGSVFLGEFLRRLKWKVMVGPRVLTGHSLVTIRHQGNPAVPIPPDLGLRTNLTAVGFTITRDTRTNRFYPNDGTVFVFTSDFFGKSLGSKYSFQSFRTLFNKYWGLSEKQVLAYNAYFCATGGQPPFYGNCIYGTNNELRGYTAGRYLDRYMIATQLEYRLQLPKRFGVVAFGGIGGVSPGAKQFFQSQDFLPAGGGGLRFLLSKQYHVNLRADLAAGKGGHTFGLGLSEAF
jgi:hypothetical protein